MWYSVVGCLVTLTLSLLAAPLPATAQSQGKIPRIGVLEPTSQARPAPCLFAFQQGLRDLGYVEGHTILLDYRYGEGHTDRLPALAAELAQRTPDVLWLHSDAAAWAATFTMAISTTQNGSYTTIALLPWPAGTSGSKSVALGVQGALAQALNSQAAWLRASVTCTGPLTLAGSWLSKAADGGPGLASRSYSLDGINAL